MRLKLTLSRPGGGKDIAVTVEAGGTVGDVARSIVERSPQAGLDPGASTLAIHSGDKAGEPLPEQLLVWESGIRSGATVSVVRAGKHYHNQSGAAAQAAVVRILEGPDAGKEFALRPGPNRVGRDRTSDVRLTDRRVSKNHAKIVVGDVVEIVDTNSSNGVLVGGGLVGRAVLGRQDAVRLGATLLEVEQRSRPAQLGTPAQPVVYLDRSPRLDPSYVGVEFVAPEPPARERGRRLPLLSLMAPLVAGAVLFAITRSPLSLVFVAMAPIMMLGSFAEGKISGRRAFRQATEEFRGALASLDAQMGAAADDERLRRQAEHPATAALIEAALRRTPLLWTRRPEHERFLELRIGLGSQPSRNTVKLPGSKNTTPTLWAELTSLAESFAAVSDVPVVAAPRSAGAIGVAGPADVAAAVARGLVTQIVTLHSPAEVVVVAATSSASKGRWEWLKWLPHTTSAHSPVGAAHLAAAPAAVTTLVAELDELVDRRAELRRSDPAPVLPMVVLVVEDDAPVDRSHLVDLAERGPGQGVHVLWVAPRIDRVPAACRTFIEVDPTGPAAGAAGFVHTGDLAAPIRLEPVDAETATRVAHGLAPLIDSGARIEDESDLPAAVSFLTVAGAAVGDSAEAVIERWVENGSLVTGPRAGAAVPDDDDALRSAGLAAVVGIGAGGDVVKLDLRREGPHALVGGTTGAGKSELLQSWILGLATQHSPQRVTFLLVDYKGGTAFKECRELPHTVGLVTDLTPNEVLRALASLNAEIRRREELFGRHGVKDLVQMEREHPALAPPSLVIIVDEFAALVSEVPQFVDGVVDVAQRGRSLGLHLILATQRPEGVIKENLRANTNLRVALRLNDTSDSANVLGSPLAAGFDPDLPGRAAARIGPGRLVTFQTAYAGGRTSAQAPAAKILIEELPFGPGQVWKAPKIRTDESARGATDIQRIVETVNQATGLAQLPKPRRPWLRPLPAVVALEALLEHPQPGQLPFGWCDDPPHQRQVPASFAPGKDGNLAVYGTGGSGKSVFLRTLAVAAGHLADGPCHVYGLDFGARGLQLLAGLPFVGNIVSGDDHELITRLLGWLRDLIDERARRYAGGVNDFGQHGGATGEPRVVLLVDGVGAFRQAYELTEHSAWFETFLAIATLGGQVGVHIVVSAEREGALPSALASAIPRRLVLRIAEEDQSRLGIRGDVLTHGSPPGRGLLDGLETQVAVFGASANVRDQAEAIERLAAKVSTWPEPVRFRLVPRQVGLEELPPPAQDLPAFGLLASTFGAATFTPAGSLIVAGPPGSGRTTTLATLRQALLSWRPGMALHYFGSRRSSLAALGWAAAAVTPQLAVELAEALAAELARGAAKPSQLAIFIESLPDFVAEGVADMALHKLVRACLAHEQLVVSEGDTQAMASAGALGALARSGRRGIVLQPDQSDGFGLFRTAFGKLRRADFPLGRGLFVTQGHAAVVQVALPSDEPANQAPIA